MILHHPHCSQAPKPPFEPARARFAEARRPAVRSAPPPAAKRSAEGFRAPAIMVLAVMLIASIAPAQRGPYPLPEERGTAGILQALDRLPVYAHVLVTIAHPDDESGGTLTWLARKAHARVALFSLTRGDGGQNILGDEKYEAMGLVRTGELIEACRLYGVEPFFASVFEFGFSKSAEETLRKWGKEQTLEEMVRFIRTWRPVIVVTGIGAGGGDSHGHHQAVGLLTPEAFRAAGDPARFPEHLKAGLLPWQAKRLLQRQRGGGITVPTGDYDPVLGRSYAEIGAEGYSRHRSQGSGARHAWPGNETATFAIVDSAPSPPTQAGSFFDGIDTSLISMLELAGEEAIQVPGLRPLLETATRAALNARAGFDPARPEKAAPALAGGLEALRKAVRMAEASSLAKARRKMLEDALLEKREDFEKALAGSLGLHLMAVAEEATAVPGQSVTIRGRLFNRGAESVELARTTVSFDPEITIRRAGDTPEGRVLPGGTDVSFALQADISRTAKVTEPFWYRPQTTDTRYRLRSVRDPFAPFEGPLITLSENYRYRGVEGTISSPARAVTADPLRGAELVDFQIVPVISVSIGPSPAVVPLSKSVSDRTFLVSIRGDSNRQIRGKIRLKLPPGWTASPAESEFSVARRSETAQRRFTVRVPPQDRAAEAAVEASATIETEEYSRGYTVISYPGNWTRHLYAPARAAVKIFDLRTPPNLTVGYIPGAGDEIPQALAQMGASARILDEGDLAAADLSPLQAIVTGIRAFNVNRGLQANNHRLLEYVSRGGTLIVQYCRPEGEGNFTFAPHEMALSNALRVTVEDSPVRILDPKHRVFRFPNPITAADFDGWVQERGLYFASRWDPQFTALLSGADPGESDLRGGMLIARHGKGTWVYTAYAWFRQLPAGVPGAYRIFANMISLGRAPG